MATKEKKEKVVPPSPPKVIRDETTGHAYQRVGFLGEVRSYVALNAKLTSLQGGFARVWEVQTIHGERKAVKVVNKASIKSKKNKTKVSSTVTSLMSLVANNIAMGRDQASPNVEPPKHRHI
jgi:hypothetical protein